MASYEIAMLVGKKKKSHNIAEEVIMPAAKILFTCKHVIGEDSVSKRESVSLSNNTVRRRIVEMAENIAVQVYAEIKSAEFGFGIQLDESTDMANCSQRLVYARYAHCNVLKSELLMNEELVITTRGEDVFQLVAKFFKSRVVESCWVHDRRGSGHAWPKGRISSTDQN